MTIDFENVPGEPRRDEIAPAPGTTVGGGETACSRNVAAARPWGPWATVGWTLLCLIVMFGGQIGVFLVFIGIRLAQNPNVNLSDAATNGNLLATATIGSTVPLVGLVGFLVWIRGCRIRDYLALVWPTPRSVFMALVGLVLVILASDLTSYSIGRPLVPEVMVGFYRTAWLPLLLIAMTVVAPLGEETLFRGFLFKGIAASRAGPITGILVSTLAFALVHVQYDWYGILLVAAMGLYLGVVRYGTGSLLLTMLVHGIANAISTAEMVIQEQWLK